MNLRQLQSLVALSELGSLSGVGRDLHLSAAAIQKQLKSLSQEFEITVYRKVGQRLELSQEARLLIPYARAILATHAAAAAALRQSKSQFRDRLLPKLIRRFSLQHPNL